MITKPVFKIAGMRILRSTKAYLRADPNEQLEALNATSAPNLRSGRRPWVWAVLARGGSYEEAIGMQTEAIRAEFA